MIRCDRLRAVGKVFTYAPWKTILTIPMQIPTLSNSLRILLHTSGLYAASRRSSGVDGVTDFNGTVSVGGGGILI